MASADVMSALAAGVAASSSLNLLGSGGGLSVEGIYKALLQDINVSNLGSWLQSWISIANFDAKLIGDSAVRL